MVSSCHITSALRALCSKSHIIILLLSSDISSIEREIIKRKLEWKLNKKPPNPIRETEEEN